MAKWAKGVAPAGPPQRDPEEDRHVAQRLRWMLIRPTDPPSSPHPLTGRLPATTDPDELIAFFDQHGMGDAARRCAERARDRWRHTGGRPWLSGPRA